MIKSPKRIVAPILWPVVYRRRDTGAIIGTGFEPLPELRLGPVALTPNPILGMPPSIRWVGFGHSQKGGRKE